MTEKTLRLTRAALIAALYVILTFIIADFRTGERSHTVQTFGSAYMYAAVLQRSDSGAVDRMRSRQPADRLRRVGHSVRLGGDAAGSCGNMVYRQEKTAAGAVVPPY